MPLSIDNRQSKLRFGGPTILRGKKNFPESNPEQYLNSLSEQEFISLFHEWLAQCWLYDEKSLIPRTPKELSCFEVKDLIPLFREKYIANDYRVVIEGFGASVDEMILCWQMFQRQLIVALINKDKALPAIMPDIAEHLLIPQKALLPIFFEFINTVYAFDFNSISTTFISDGVSGHVFNAIHYDEQRSVLLYEDNIGKNNTCFLNKENNALGIDSTFVGMHPFFRTRCWEISLQDFEKVFCGFPVIHSHFETLRLAETIAQSKMY